MNHYEVRSWQGWHRHILLTLIAHLFVIKMRRQLSVLPHKPGVAPYVDSPVPLGEYLDARMKLESNEPIDNPPIMAMPDKPRTYEVDSFQVEKLSRLVQFPFSGKDAKRFTQNAYCSYGLKCGVKPMAQVSRKKLSYIIVTINPFRS